MPKFSLKEARALAQQEKIGPAMAHYFAVLKSYPEKVDYLQNEFLQNFRKFIATLALETTELRVPLEYFTMAGEFYGSSSQFLTFYADFLLKNRCEAEGIEVLFQSVALEPKQGACCAEARHRLSNLRSHLLDQWHFHMLNDRKRNLAYKIALQKRISELKEKYPDETLHVLDIGAGTGLLSMYAAQYGAAKVFALEESNILCSLAKKIVKDNDFPPDQIKIVGENSTDFQPESPLYAHLVITELMDAGFFGENMLTAVQDARNRLISQTECIIVPHSAKIFAALIECEDIEQQHWCSEIPGFALKRRLGTFLACNDASRKEPYTTADLSQLERPFKLLSEPKVVDDICLNDAKDLEKHISGISFEVPIVTSHEGMVNAVVVWFEVELAPGIKISSHPDADSCWDQAIFPTAPPLEVAMGQSLSVCYRVERDWMECRMIREEKPANLNLLSPLCMHESAVATANDENFVKFWMKSLSASQLNEAGTILDVCQNPILTLLSAFVCSKARFYVLAPEDGVSNFEMLLDDYPEISSRVHLLTKQELDSVETGKISALLIFPLTPEGLLRQNSLEDIAYYRLKFCIPEVFPRNLEVWGKLVECDQLLEYTRLVSDSKTELKIKDTINLFETRVQQDLNFTNMVSTSLSTEFHLMSVNFNEHLEQQADTLPLFLAQNVTVQVPLVQQGKPHAFVCWFRINNFSTMIDSKSLRVSAHLLPEALSSSLLDSKSILELNCTLERSDVEINVAVVH